MKNPLHKVLFLALAICITTVKLNAQTTGDGKITAKVVDAKTNETIPFATAVILNRKTKALVKGVQTDINGNLSMVGLPKGVFTFKLSYVGYQTMVRDSISINGTVNNINLGTIKMGTAKGTALNEVTITAPKSTIQLGVDKKIFSVDQSLVSEGGSASDLLQNVPSVTTDIEGNVSLRGSTGVKVLIDGKPSLIAGGNVAQILQSIPASSIESVELITNPSAKYDAEGQSGIINIVLKKNKKLGLNGNLALTAGNRDNYNASTSLSFQNSKVNLYGNYSYRYGNRNGGGYNNISYLNSSSPIAFANQNTISESLDKGHNAKAGLDYYLTDKDMLSFAAGFNLRDNDRNEFLNINKLNALNQPVELSNRVNSNLGSGGSYDLNLDYSHKFKKPREEITFNLSFSEGTNDNLQLYNTDIYNVDGVPVSQRPELIRNDGSGLNRNYNAQTDYTMPIGKTGKLEAGYRSQIRIAENSTFSETYHNNVEGYRPNLDLTNDFNSKDQVHAIYANYQNSVKNFGYQVGLRAEDATLDTKLGVYNTAGQLSYIPGKVAYTRLYPSIFLTQKLEKEQQVQLSYSRRVNRPRGWDTNPFLDVSDPLNYRQGNPNLKPEDVHAFELSYSKFWPKVTFISTAYMRQTNDVIQRIRTEPDDNGITITTPENLTKEISSGLELIGRFDVVKAWNFTANANLYQSKINGVPAFGIIENSGFTWNANLTNNFVLPYGITLQLKGDYRARQVMAQGTRNAMYGVDAGAKYDFKNKKSSLSLNVRDIFNTRAWSMTTSTNNSITDFKRYMQGTMGNITYSYRFGKTDFKSKKGKKPDQSEMRSDEESF
ncbi:outer membrane beta-barrel family protein [Pedobacter gandavensis]|uniref:outer membrane beta-barrel family protein n=1 Tax=Pedobacter gandavensis TaxID=2679963 RepID=UPI00247A5591|nr:outer membrane beta-barrel family protein [Pedobacter gandavensis]WGQ08071.1 outer membrane beta-barrel family protein [Pedobacter gandavensis]